jgi:hypothetical protein
MPRDLAQHPKVRTYESPCRSPTAHDPGVERLDALPALPEWLINRTALQLVSRPPETYIVADPKTAGERLFVKGVGKARDRFMMPTADRNNLLDVVAYRVGRIWHLGNVKRPS